MSVCQDMGRDMGRDMGHDLGLFFLHYFYGMQNDAFGVVGTMCKVKKKKTYFWDIHSFLLRMLGLK